MFFQPQAKQSQSLLQSLLQKIAIAASVTAMLACTSTPVVTPEDLPVPAPIHEQAQTPGPAPATPAAPPAQSAAQPVTLPQAPAAPREFRAAWVSTVSNIDWPSRSGLSSEKQKAEALSILDSAVQLKLNAIILQVRPGADAIYPSQLEPWSEFLTGVQDQAPDPWYDPLQFWIEQAHLRGLELHAWFNPYRARTGSTKTVLSKRHISKTAPAAVKQYGNLLWMDPSDPAAMQQTVAVILDVVRRYDVDGVHIDDYFYPYPINAKNGRELEFPDQSGWARYKKTGGSLSRPDWRRDNVNRLVETIYKGIHQEKNWVQFGISPFGIGRQERLPADIIGFSQYDKLYADVELWLEKGWLDYLAPQLYWPIDQAPQAFRTLQDYWLSQNPNGRYVWPGLYTSRLDNSDKSWSADEILNQVDATREKPNSGQIHFSMSALLQNRKNIRDRLIDEKYTSAALSPAMPWLGPKSTQAPELITVSTQKIEVRRCNAPTGRVLAIWRRFGQRWIFSVQAISDPFITLENDIQYGALRQLVVTCVDRTGQESPQANYLLP